MKVSILTIGDEILNGTTVDTNSAYMARNCIANGWEIEQVLSVSDTYNGIHSGLKILQENADVILITGGLGPTKDDITKQALADFFGVELVLNNAVYEKIAAYFSKGGQKQIDLNAKLAYLPKNAEVIDNERGTAQGMWFEFQNKIYISMPGVPHEMKHMLSNAILPKLKAKYHTQEISNFYIMCAGIGESAIYERIEDIENDFPSYIHLAYLPSLGHVKLRITCKHDKSETHKKTEALAFRDKIASRIKEHVYSFDEQKTLAAAVGDLLKDRNESIATAESCTGGYIAHLLTSISGSSAYFEGSVVAYSYNIKETLLDVKETTLNTVGAVSEETVKEMAAGLLYRMKTNYAIAVSGIAGPGGGTKDKPVGTVWIAVANSDKVIAKRFQLTKHRDYNIKISAHLALNMLRNFIVNH